MLQSKHKSNLLAVQARRQAMEMFLLQNLAAAMSLPGSYFKIPYSSVSSYAGAMQVTTNEISGAAGEAIQA